MTYEWLPLSAADPDPAPGGMRGVTPIAAPDRRLHAPDCSLLLLHSGSLVARCSCWWTATPVLEGRPVGVIGHYAAADADAGSLLLSRACERLAAAGIALAVGPMDGTTWRRYRFIVERGDEPVFFLEPDNPDDWPDHWARAGFSRLATYTSAVAVDPGQEDPRTATALLRQREAGIAIRPLQPARADADLRRIYRLSLAAFQRNFLYSPISEPEFVAQYQAVMPHVRPELVLLAEQNDALVGFIFALPDPLEARRDGKIRSAILKTVAVDPAMSGMGLGGALVDLVQRRARDLGYSRTIHALMHEGNVSRRISDRSARTFRRYALFSRALTR